MPNLNKIRLYCILNNIKDIKNVPSCLNCNTYYISDRKCYTSWITKGALSGTKLFGIAFSFSKDFRKFKLGSRLHHKSRVCNNWGKK